MRILVVLPVVLGPHRRLKCLMASKPCLASGNALRNNVRIPCTVHGGRALLEYNIAFVTTYHCLRLRPFWCPLYPRP